MGLPTESSHDVDMRYKNRRAYREYLNQENKLNDDGQFVVQNVQDSLLSNANLYAKQSEFFQSLKGKTKEQIAETFSAIKPYREEITPYQSEDTAMVAL